MRPSYPFKLAKDLGKGAGALFRKCRHEAAAELEEIAAELRNSDAENAAVLAERAHGTAELLGLACGREKARVLAEQGECATVEMGRRIETVSGVEL